MEKQVDKRSLNIYQKLIEVRKSALYIKKENKAFNYVYANTGDLLGALRPAMDEVGVLLVPNIEKFQIIKVKRVVEKKGMEPIVGEVEVPMLEISYTWINADNPEERVRTCATFYDDKMTGAQGIGSLLTYSERYFLYKFFQVATDSDDMEKFYEKHNLSALAEVIPTEKKEEESNAGQKFVKSFEECEFLAYKFWKKLREKIPSLPENMREDMPYHLHYVQELQPEIDLAARLDPWLTNAEKYIKSLDSWYESKGKLIMESMCVADDFECQKVE